MHTNHAFDLDVYLGRLDYSGPVKPTEDALESLHHAQIHRIPFENFDILLGRGIALDPASIFDKLVRRPRGGYCFELSGLFLQALQAIGFEARALLARILIDGTPTGRGHQVVLVTINGRPWISDVGFGGPHLRAPIPLEFDRPITRMGESFRLLEVEPYGIMVQTQRDSDWRDLYSFDLGHVFPADIEYGNHFTSTHPSSLFTYARIGALPTSEGRVSILNRTLRRVTGDEKYAEELPEGEAYLEALKSNFGIELDAPYEALGRLAVTDRETEAAFEE